MLRIAASRLAQNAARVVARSAPRSQNLATTSAVQGGHLPENNFGALYHYPEVADEQAEAIYDQKWLDYFNQPELDIWVCTIFLVRLFYYPPPIYPVNFQFWDAACILSTERNKYIFVSSTKI